MAHHPPVLRPVPHFVDEPTRADAERKLAEVASQYRPDELQRFADHYEVVLNPDGISPTMTAPVGAASLWALREPTA